MLCADENCLKYIDKYLSTLLCFSSIMTCLNSQRLIRIFKELKDFPRNKFKLFFKTFLIKLSYIIPEKFYSFMTINILV